MSMCLHVWKPVYMYICVHLCLYMCLGFFFFLHVSAFVSVDVYVCRLSVYLCVCMRVF